MAKVRGKRRKAAQETAAGATSAALEVSGGSEWVGVGRSGIHQNGLFAKKDIPKGTKMIEYVGDKIIKAESERRGNEQDELGRPKGDGTVYVFTLNNRYDIDGAVEWNEAKNANHSCAPNAATDILKGRIWLIAERKIKKGEEITYDYGFDLNYWRDHPCRCGTKKCVGYIVGEEYRAELKKKIKAWEKKQAKEAAPEEEPEEVPQG
jgi:uncharacterized protein